jgi:hypothetical protein
MLSVSAQFSGLTVHYAVCALVLLASVSSCSSSSATSAAMAMGKTKLSVKGVLGLSSGRMFDVSGLGSSLDILTDRIHTQVGCGNGHPVFNDLNCHSI